MQPNQAPSGLMDPRALLERNRQRLMAPGLMDPDAVRGVAELGVGMLPGAGDVMSAMESQQAGQRMAEAWQQGDYGRAFGGLMESVGHGLGALPMIPSLMGMVRAFHGSPHRFDKFDISKIGTGEGAQAYGHGLYFAESPHVAGSYQRALTATHGPSVADWAVENPELAKRARQAINEASDRLGIGRPNDDIFALLLTSTAEGAPPDAFSAELADQIKISWQRPRGSLYNVTLDVEPEDLLDWDAPLSQQSEKVRKALEQFVMEPNIDVRPHPNAGKAGTPATAWQIYDKTTDIGIDAAANEEMAREFAEQIRNRQRSGAGAYQQLAQSLGSPQAASRALAEAGIPGLRYFDAGSRGAGEGTRNVVMFRDDLINIEGVE